MACTWREAQASRYADGALDREESAEYARHLDGCEACRARVAEQRRADALLRESIVPVEPPPALLGRVAQAVALEREKRRPGLGWLPRLRRRRLATVLASLLLALALAIAAAGPGEVVALVQRALYTVPGLGVRAVDADSLVAAKPVVVREGSVVLTVVSLLSDGKRTTVSYSVAGLPGGKWGSTPGGGSPPQPLLRDARGVEYPATGASQGIGGSAQENHATGSVEFGPLPGDLTSVDLVVPRDFLLAGAPWPEGTPSDFVAHIPLSRPSASGLARAVPQSASATVNGVTLSVAASSAGSDATTVLLGGAAPGDARVVWGASGAGDPANRVSLRDDRGRAYGHIPEQLGPQSAGAEQQSLEFEPLAAGATTLTLTVPSLSVVEPGTAALDVSLAGHEPGETFAIGKTIRLGGHDVVVKSGRIDRDAAGDLWLYLDVGLGPTVDGQTASELSVDEPHRSLVMRMGARNGAQLDQIGIALEPGEQQIRIVLSNLRVTVKGPWVLTFPVKGQPIQ